MRASRIMHPLALNSCALLLAGCGLISGPIAALENSLQRDDKIHARYGAPLELVTVGDSRESVRKAWGSPRPTFPVYPEFDLYLVVRSSDGSLRVLPGEYDKLGRTSLYLMRTSYAGGRVSENRVFGSNSPGSRRDWCDPHGECGEIFIRHSVSRDTVTNPLIIATRQPGFDTAPAAPRGACEFIVFPSDDDPYWLNALQYAEIRQNRRPVGIMTADTFLRLSSSPGHSNVQASWESWGGGGTLAENSNAGLDVQCLPGQRRYLSVGPVKTGFWMINRGIQVTEAVEANALERLAVLREVRLPSGEPEAAVSQ